MKRSAHCRAPFVIGNKTLSEKSSPINIRRASVDEAEAIAAILYEAFAEYESLYTPEGFAATTPTAEQIQQRWSEGPVWVAVQNDRLVGTVAATPRGEALYIRSMALLPAARGQGIGRRLLNQAEDFAREQGYRQLLLSTISFLTHAIQLYEQSGFQQTSEGPQDWFGTPLITMVKPLNREGS
jgi:putative acetyltransferase